MEVSNKVQREILSQTVQMTLGPFIEKTFFFLLYDTAPVNSLGRDLLSQLKGLTPFACNGGLTLRQEGRWQDTTFKRMTYIQGMAETSWNQLGPR